MASLELAPPRQSSYFEHRSSVVGVEDRLIHHTVNFVQGLSTKKPTCVTRTNRGDTVYREDGLKVSNRYASLLQACTSMKQLKQVHAQVIGCGLDQAILLRTKLVNMYAMFGSVEDARLIFDKFLNPNVVLWNAMIGVYARNGQWEEALALYYQMRTRVHPNNFTFPYVLKACAAISALKDGKEIHDHVAQFGFDSDLFVASALVNMYIKCGSIDDARHVFDKMSTRDGVLWNAMIAGYALNGDVNEAFALFNQMQHAEVKPSSVTMMNMLPSCARHLEAMKQGKTAHGYIIRCGFASDVIVATALVDTYVKCGSVEDARHVFDEMSVGDVVLWNSMIGGCVQNGNANEALILFNRMQQLGTKPDSVTMLSVLPACSDLGALHQGRRIHGYIVRVGLGAHVPVRNSLIDMYAKCECVESARSVFDNMPKRDAVSWNAMISGYAQNGHANESLTLLYQMQLADLKPDPITLASVLPACSYLGALRQVHDYVIRNGFETKAFVGTALIDMYAKCGSMAIARRVFDKMPERNVTSWNSMISGYSQNGYCTEALTLFNRMQLENVKADSITVVSVLSACAQLGDLQQGQRMHDYIISNEFKADVAVVNSLVDMYAKCGKIEVAYQLFEKMAERDVVSWNVMISCYAQIGLANEAWVLLHEMQLAEVKPNLVTIVCVLPACAHLGSLQQGKMIHGYIIRRGWQSDIVVGTALIDMYAKCGSIGTARQLFDQMSKRNVISWSAMIAGYGMNGLGEDALALFIEMLQAGIKPSGITLISVLSACSHAGLVDKGWQYFDCMSQDYGITPKVEHYACMVDLLGRAGSLDEAFDFIKKMPLEPSADVWGALLGACRIHFNIELGECVADHVFDLEPENVGYYVLLSNIYAAAGRWDDVTKVRTMMKGRGLKKTPGCSWIEVNNRIHSFLVGDRSHPQSEKIYAVLETLAMQIREAGYVPNMNLVLHDVED